MLLLRNKEYRSNNPLTSFATCICRRSSGHEWTASLPLHETRTANLPLVQCVIQANKLLLQEIN